VPSGQSQKGLLFVISAPSGCGKTSLVERLIKICPGLVRSVSITTRKPRKDERTNKDYKFVSKATFEKLKKSGKFLEWAKVFDHYYGTSREFVNKWIKRKKDVLLTIDVQGALKIKKRRPNSVFVFVLPPSRDELKKRLKKRKTEDPTEIKKRLTIAKWEMSHTKYYDHRIVNDKLHLAARRLKTIVLAERRRTKMVKDK